MGGVVRKITGKSSSPAPAPKPAAKAPAADPAPTPAARRATRESKERAGSLRSRRRGYRSLLSPGRQEEMANTLGQGNKL